MGYVSSENSPSGEFFDGGCLVEAAEGATEVAIDVVRRVDIRRAEVEEVGAGRRFRSTRPDIAVAADAAYVAVVDIYIPATDKSQW